MGEWIENPDGTWRWVPTPTPQVEEPQTVEPAAEQEDLSHLDTAVGPLVNTEKLGPLDAVLMQPPQHPDWDPEEDWS